MSLIKSKVLVRYNLSSILKTGLVTALLASLILMGVDLFSNLDTYMNYDVGFFKALWLTALYFPEAFLLAMGPAFLFAVTYHISMLYANNEIMSILNSGISFSAVVLPIILLSFFLSVFYFGFNEKAAIPASNRKEALLKMLTDSYSSEDNRDIALSDIQNTYMVFAGTYVDSSRIIYELTLIEKAQDGFVARRTNAYKAVYDGDTGFWTFYDAYVYNVGFDSEIGENAVEVSHIDRYENHVMTLEPQLFRNASGEISKMSLKLAKAYLDRMKALNPDKYSGVGTEFYKRIFSCLTPIVMIAIACGMNYRFKKNVLFLSLVSSICVAVVYFVVRMITEMLANQGVIAPQLGTLLPFAVILILSLLFGSVFRKQ